MKFAKQKKLYLPALIILAAVFIMLILISISTFQNFNRQKRTTRDLVHHQGIALLQALEAGALSAKVKNQWDADSLGYLIDELAKIDDIAYIYVIDADGSISHRSSSQASQGIENWHGRLDSMNDLATRIVHKKDGSEIYEVVKRLDVSEKTSTDKHDGQGSQHDQNVDRHHAGGTVVMGMKMQIYDEAHRADIHHTFIMMVIVIALGASAVYFIYVINNYYRMNRILRQTQDYARQVVASLASGLLSIDPDGHVVSYNQPALELLGVSADQIKSMPLDHILDFVETGIQDTLAQGRPNLEKEIRFKNKDAQEVPMAVSVTPIRMENNDTHGAVIVLRDLTEIKTLEAQMRQSEKLAAIGKLAASVAHEIRNPLSSIKGFAKYLYKTMGADDDSGEYANVIVQEVDRINSVINDLITLARPATINSSVVDTVALVNHVILLVKPDTDAQNISVNKQFSKKVGKIGADANQLTQALLNLLLNAVHAIDRDGTITVGIDVEKKPGYIRIWVKDDGPGISDEDCAKIFDPFFTTRKSGTGLGLAIVQRIVENHYGIICVESPLQGETRGSLFSILLPVTKDIKKLDPTAACG